MEEKEILKLFSPNTEYTATEICFLTKQNLPEINSKLEQLVKKEKLEYKEYETGDRRFKLIEVERRK